MRKTISGLPFILPMTIMIIVLRLDTTSAYLTSYDVKNNITAAGYNNTVIEEEFPTVSPVPIKDNPKYTKKVWVSNKDQLSGSCLVDCYVRIRIEYSNSDIGDAVQLLGLNTTDWIKEGEFYYYDKILKKNQDTTPLMTGYQVDYSKVKDDCKKFITDFEINVYEESVQADGFSSYKEAFAYYTGREGL